MCLLRTGARRVCNPRVTPTASNFTTLKTLPRIELVSPVQARSHISRRFINRYFLCAPFASITPMLSKPPRLCAAWIYRQAASVKNLAPCGGIEPTATLRSDQEL